jgi:CheY-like chemotaxis protein
MHGGQLEARSGGLGRGSEFRVHLPVAAVDESGTPAGAASSGMPAGGRRRRILVVDDNRDAALALEMFLRLMKHETRLAYSGVQAIEMAEEFRPDMILMDIGMPEMDGCEATRRIREKPWSQGTQIIALTGWGQDDDRRRSRESGFDHHFTKPLNTDALLTLLSEPAGDGAQ